MTVVRVPRDDFAGGDLPPVCARSGEVTDTMVPSRATRVPWWIWPLLVLGFVPFFIALFFTLRVVEGAVPLSRQRADEITLLRQASRLSLAVGVLLLFGWLLIEWPALALLGAAALGAALVLWLGRRDLQPTAALRGDEVVLRGVHPHFHEAVQTHYASPRTDSPLTDPWSDTPGDER